jgi:hypothetical protein
MGCCGSRSAQVSSSASIAIGLFGLDRSGKTCFFRSLQGNFDFDTIPTKTEEQAIVSISNHSVVVHDFGYNVGQPASQWSEHFASLWGFVFLIDGSDRDRYNLSQSLWLEIVCDKRMVGKPFVLVSNKRDIANAMHAGTMQRAFPGAVAFIDASAGVAGARDSGVALAASRLIGAILKYWETIRVKVEADSERPPPPPRPRQSSGAQPDHESESRSEDYVPDA